MERKLKISQKVTETLEEKKTLSNWKLCMKKYLLFIISIYYLL